MPGAFPPPLRGSFLTWAKNLPTMPARAAGVPVPSLVFPSAANLAGKKGLSMIRVNPNASNPGFAYQEASAGSIVNPVNAPISDGRVFNRVLASLNMTLSGVSKDSTGATLGTCRVMIFRTEDMTFVAETTSDASGNWSVPMLKGGPFFLVEYKTGAPDVAGTSVNTLVPARV